jgi:hypothetical protein
MASIQWHRFNGIGQTTRGLPGKDVRTTALALALAVSSRLATSAS